MSTLLPLANRLCLIHLNSSYFTPSENTILRILGDGERHELNELITKTQSKSANSLRMIISNIRKKLKQVDWYKRDIKHSILEDEKTYYALVYTQQPIEKVVS